MKSPATTENRKISGNLSRLFQIKKAQKPFNGNHQHRLKINIVFDFV